MSLVYASFALMCHLIQVGSEINVEDVVAGYRQNALQASSLVVRWQVEEQRGPRSGELLKQQCEFAEQRGDHAGAKSWRQQLESDQELDHFIWLRECLTDRTNLQDRVANDPKTGLQFFRSHAPAQQWPLLGSFPQDLNQHFRHVQIASLGAETSGAVRLWVGKPFQGRSTAAVGPAHPGLRSFDCPPLVMPEESWGAKGHLLDEFFSGRSEQYVLLGRTQIDQTPVILLERRWSWSGNGREGCVRAFVDPQRGYLPLRMEFFFGDLEAWRDRRQPLLKWDDQRYFAQVLVVEDIVEREQIFYPMRGRLEEHGILFRDGKPSDSVAVTIRSWNVTELHVNEEIPANVFAVPLPEGTLVHSGATAQQYLSGNVNDYLKEVLPGQNIALPQRDWKKPALVIGTLFVAAASFLVVWIRRRGDWKRGG